MKLCHLCTDVCQKTGKAGTSEPSDAQQRTCLAIRSITDLLMVQGLICLDFVDVSSVLREGGIAVVGIGEATGEGRATRAVETAILDLKRQLAAMHQSTLMSSLEVVKGCSPADSHIALWLARRAAIQCRSPHYPVDELHQHH